MSDSESDSDEWSDAEYFDNLGAFDLVILDENEKKSYRTDYSKTRL